MMGLIKSAHGEIVSYFMPLEELKAKFGEAAGKRYGEKGNGQLKPDPKQINWNWQKLTIVKYADLKKQGFTDSDIVNNLPWMNWEYLKRMKKGWGIAE